MQPIPCTTGCGCPTPLPVQIPGSPGQMGNQGIPGAQGIPGPAGSIPTPVSSYNATGTNVLATSSVATANGAIFGTSLPQVILPVMGGVYELQARARVDGAGATLSTQTLTVQLFSVTASAAIANTTRVFDFVPSTTVSGTRTVINTPTVFYTCTATNEVIQMYGVVSAATGAGTLVCVEADLTAVQIK